MPRCLSTSRIGLICPRSSVSTGHVLATWLASEAFTCNVTSAPTPPRRRDSARGWLDSTSRTRGQRGAGRSLPRRKRTLRSAHLTPSIAEWVRCAGFRGSPSGLPRSLTYVDTNTKLTATTTHEWNHGLGEIITSLFAECMHLTGLHEDGSVPWTALPGLMEHLPDGEFRLRIADGGRPTPTRCTQRSERDHVPARG